MKIHFDNQIFRLQKYGGISRYFVRLAEQLKYLGHEPKILGGFHTNAYLRDLPSTLKTGKFLDKYPKRTIRLLRDSGNVINQVYSTFSNPDILHETYFSEVPFIRGGKPRVITEYDCLHEIYPELFPVSYLKTKEKQAAFQRADLILAISHQTKRDLLDYFSVPEHKIQVTHLAADPALPDEELEIPGNFTRPFLLYVGIRLKHKNFEPMVRAFADSKLLMGNFDLIVFTPNPFSSDEIDLFQRLGFAKDQVSRESGDDRRLFGFFKKATAFIYPSKYEGFGIPPLEAMTYGCPVVCSSSSSLPEVVGEAALTFDPENPEEMTSQMEKIANDPILRAELIQKGYNRIKLFSWEKTATDTLKLYKSIC